MTIPVDPRNLSYAQVMHMHDRLVQRSPGSEANPLVLLERVALGGITADEYRALNDLQRTATPDFNMSVSTFVLRTPDPSRNYSERQTVAVARRAARAPRERWNAATAEAMFTAINRNGLSRTEYFALRGLVDAVPLAPATFRGALTRILDSHVPVGLPGSAHSVDELATPEGLETTDDTDVLGSLPADA